MNQQTIPTADRNWCRNLMALLADGGTWGVPRSGLNFRKRRGELALVGRMPHHPALPISAEEWATCQQDDYQTIKRHFEAAGFKVPDETKGKQT